MLVAVSSFLFAFPLVRAWNSTAIDTLYLSNSSLQLSFVANGTGTNGGIYQAPVGTSQSNASYGTYYYCDMPHPRATEYELPSAISSGQVSGQLVFLEYVQRHHKRTAYNILPGGENQIYNCSDVRMFEQAATAGGEPVHVFAQTYDSPTNPFYVNYVNGTCIFPQITSGGVLDAIVHGQDFWSVYGEMLHFLPTQPDDSIYFRTSESELTEATSGGVIHGMYPNYHLPVPIHQQSMDTINEGYPCSAISQIQTWYMQDPQWIAHIQAAAPLVSKLNPMLGTTNNSAWLET
jgi:2-phosphoxylose phosphatase